MAHVFWPKILKVIFISELAQIISANQIKGPIFIKEPKSKIEFLNTDGAVLDCLTHGDPEPKVKWYRQTGIEEMVEVVNVPSLVQTHSNGSLEIHSFAGDRYNQEIHATVYRCAASNIHGKIISYPVSVKATTKQQQQLLQAQVYDEYVIAGNTAVLTCHIPPFYRDDLEIVSWIREDNFMIEPNEPKKGMEMVKNGQLLIQNVTSERNIALGFWCQVRNKLTGDTFLSQSAGRIHITEHQGGVPPTVSYITEKASVKLGQSIELNCAGQGYPPPVYVWKSVPDGHIVSRNSRIKVGKSHEPGTFQYTCKVENKFGIDESRVSVVVREPLETYIQPNIQTVNSGEEINLECNINGHPIEEIIWRKNGKLIMGNGVIPESKYRLKIKAANREHEGMYQCFVRNSWESIQTAAQVKIGDMAPVFIKTFKPKKLQPGPSISLKCVASGRPTPKITWKLNGRVVRKNDKFIISEQQYHNGTTISRFVVKNLMPHNGGEHECTASNKVNSISYNNVVDVYGPPYVHDMENITIAAGGSKSIKCYVSGYPIASVSWIKDSRRFYENKSQKTIKNKLIIENATEKDEGFYTCVANNGRGLASEKKLFINVIKKPILAPLPPPPEMLPATNSYSTICTILSGDQPIILTWLKDNTDASMMDKVDVTNTKTYSLLQIHQVGTKHSGNYSCVAQNKAGKTVKSITLKVASSPKWLIEPKTVTTPLKAEILIHCKAEAYPTPKVKWFRHIKSQIKEILPFEEENIQLLQNGSLKIDVSNKEMGGDFSCVVANGIEPDLMKKISIIIKDPLKILIQFLGYRKDKALVECKVHGHDDVRVQWSSSKAIFSTKSKRFKTKLKESGHQTTSTLTVMNPRHKEMFWCKASTKQESVEKSIILPVHGNNTTDAPLKIVEGPGYTNDDTMKATTRPEVKHTMPIKLNRTEKIKIQRDESIIDDNQPFQAEKSHTKVISDEDSDPELRAVESILNGSKPDLKTLLLFVLPAVAIFVLLILVIITLAAYFITKKTNHRKRNVKQEYSGIDSLTRSTRDGRTLASNRINNDQRYGKLDRSAPMSDHIEIPEYQNAYEIPDYYTGMKPYSTLQFSPRNHMESNSMPRCSKVSL